LLHATLRSFYRHVDVAPQELIVVEDSANEQVCKIVDSIGVPARTLVNGSRLGQMRSKQNPDVGVARVEPNRQGLWGRPKPTPPRTAAPTRQVSTRHMLWLRQGLGGTGLTAPRPAPLTSPVDDGAAGIMMRLHYAVHGAVRLWRGGVRSVCA
jgi:hypothetical protein